MKEYIKLFNNHNAYTAFTQTEDFVKPNVSLCVQENEIHYNPYVPPSRVITAVFNIPTTANPISLTYENGWNDIESVVVTSPNGSTFELSYGDLVQYDSIYGVDPLMAYQFDTTGNYTFEYTLKPNVDTINPDLLCVPYITSIAIPNSVTSIGNSAFQGCSGLTSITIPDSVTSIGDLAFINCKSLTSITIPNSVTFIDGAFQRCYFTISNFINNSNLDEVTNNYWLATIVDSDTNGFCIQNNSLVNYRGTATTITIPSGVTSIGQSAFSGYDSLTSVTIGNNVTSISSHAFWGCRGLASVTIGNNVTSIHGNAFYDCSSLASVIIEATTPPTLDTYVFTGNPNGWKIYVPSASVETYKAATNWSTYADRIQAIPTT